MHKREEFSFLKGTWKKLHHKVSQLIDNDKLYAINYANLKRRFFEEIEKYKNNPELIDVEEFSMNYTFGYHFCNNIDDTYSKQAMFIEVKSYLSTLNLRA